MTCDQAIAENIKYFRTTLQIQAMTRSEDEIRKMAAAQIDFYAAIGMLKLDEPKSADEQFIQAIINHGFHKSVGEQVLGAIQVAGLKIVSK